MDKYAVTDGLHRQEFWRGTEPAAFAQARGWLAMDPRLDPDLAELQVWQGDSWESLGSVQGLPRQAPYHDEVVAEQFA